MPAYAYPEGNDSLKRTLNLQPHPEGGFFVQTHAMEEEVPSPFASGAPRQFATQIYYLLAASAPSSAGGSPASHRGKLHLNRSCTYHLLHQGRARYTLVRPTADGSKPEIKHVVMGADSARGEQRQLVVEGGWWKASEVPEEDLREAQGRGEEDTTGCLISEVVVPGFSFDDHEFLTRQGLVELFGGDEACEEVQQLLPYVQDDK